MKKRRSDAAAWSIMLGILVLLFAGWAFGEGIQKAPDSAAVAEITQELAESGVLSGEVVKKLNGDQIVAAIKKIEEAKVASQYMNTTGKSNHIVPIGGLVFILLIVGLVSFNNFRKTKLTHETIRIMVEKGIAIPPDLFMSRKKQGSDLRKGVILITIGLSSTVAFLFLPGGAWAIGLVPLAIGIGYLVIWGLGRKNRNTENNNA